MSVAKVTEITATSPKSFDAALRAGVQRANKTLKNVNLWGQSLNSELNNRIDW